MFLVGHGQINQSSLLTANNLPATPEIVCRQTEFVGKDVHGSHRHQSEGRARPGDAIHDLVDRSIAPCSHYPVKALCNRISRAMLGVSRADRRAKEGVATDRPEPFFPTESARAPRGGV